MTGKQDTSIDQDGTVEISSEEKRNEENSSEEKRNEENNSEEERKEEDYESMSDKQVDTTNVFVKYLPSDVDDDSLRSMFSPFGKIESAKVIVNPRTWQSLGYGFVRFSSEGEANHAINMMQGHKVQNKMLLCKLSDKFAFPSPSTNLYIKPLPPAVTEDELRSVFTTFGTIQTVKIVRDLDKPNDVIGLVRYEKIEDAQNAINSTHGTAVLPNWQNLIVKFAESDVQRANRKASIHPPPRRRSTEIVTTKPVSNSKDIASKIISEASAYISSKKVISETPYYSESVQPTYGQPMSYAYPQYYFMPASPHAYTVFAIPFVQEQTSVPYGWYNNYDNKIYPCYVTSK